MDSPDQTAGPLDAPADDRRPEPGSRPAKALVIAAWALVFGTSAAVAALAWWLVPPYLALMGMLLYEPAGRRVNATNPARPDAGVPEGVSTPDDAPSPAVADPTGEPPEPPAPPEGDAATTPAAATAVKARRATKGRARKARGPAEPAPATWVQVAPGKFVRVEAGTLAEPGPHATPTATPPETAADAAGPDLPPDHPARPDAEDGDHAIPAGEAPDDAVLQEPAPPPAADRHDDAPAEDLTRSEVDPSGPDADAPQPETETLRDGPGQLAASEPTHPEACPDPDPFPLAGDNPDDALTATDGRSEPAPAESVEDAHEPGPSPADADPADDPAPGPDHDPAERDAPRPAAVDSPASRSDAGPDTADAPAEALGPLDAERPAPIPDRPAFAPASAWAPGRPAPRPATHPRVGRLRDGNRQRSERGGGRPHRFARAFPPRSPPGRLSARA